MKIKELPISVIYSIYYRYLFRYKPSPKVPVIVSLTSIPSRLNTLDLVIKSLFNQSKQPKEIKLWLNHSLKNSIPSKLLNLQNDVFQIKFCDGTSSFRKLIPTLKESPNATIITCDDDAIYPSNWLEHLYGAHIRVPNHIICQVGRLISYDHNGILKDYKNWSFVNYNKTAPNLLPIGYGGILYPRKTFDEKVFNSNEYLNLCPKADDLWFKAIAFLNKKSATCASEKAKPIPIFRSQTHSLGSTNINKNGNCDQWIALCNRYQSLKEIS